MSKCFVSGSFVIQKPIQHLSNVSLMWLALVKFNAMWCGDVTKVVEMLDTAMMGDICDDTF